MISPAPKLSHSHPTLVQHLKTALDQEVEALDMATQSNLTQIRHKVLAHYTRRTKIGRLWWASGLIVAGIGAVVLSQALYLSSPTALPMVSNPVVSNVALPEVDLPTIELLLAEEEEWEFLESLDLYTWLVAEYG